jgi:geranylgeranyl diphosphate synthase type I
MQILSLEEYCLKFEKDFSQFLSDNLLRLEQTWPTSLGHPEREYLTDKLLKYTLEATKGGKRFRPYLIYLQASPLSYEASLNYAIAVELLHSFALVHDDFMDKAETRRSKKTVNQFFCDELNQLKIPSKVDVVHYANSMAVLVGDYLFSLAEESFEDNENIELGFHKNARSYFKILKSEVILGQMLDIELSLYENPSKNEILQKTFLKTANYSVTRPMQIGTAILNTEKSEFVFCEEFGLKLGLGFQIQDDYLNLAYGEEVTGKKQYADIEEGKHTLASWYLLNHENGDVKSEFKEIFGISMTNLEDCKKLLEESGVLDYLKKEISKYYYECEQLTKNERLASLVNYLKLRTK